MSDPICPLCDRPIPGDVKQSLHHLIPKLKGGKGGPTVLLHHICGLMYQTHQVFQVLIVSAIHLPGLVGNTTLKLAKSLLVLFIAVVGAVNLAFFVYWYSASEVTAIMPVSPTGYTVEALALNVTILEMILVLVGFILAALGLFGYTEIKNAAIRAAEKEARDTVSEQLRILRAVMSSKAVEAPEHGGDYGLEDQPVRDATKAKDE